MEESLADVAVVIPAYRAERTIAAAVASARAAGVGEVLVVDDGSDDATAATAEGAGATVVTQANAGPSAARLTGLSRTHATFVVFLDADDQVLTEGLVASQGMLERDPAAPGVLGGVIGIDGTGAEKALGPLPERVDAAWLVARGYAPRPPVGVMWRVATLRSGLAAEPTALAPRYAEDYELMIRGALARPLITHGVPVARYAMTGGKSDRHPERSARAAMEIAHYYGSVVGVRVAPATDRRARAHVLIRQSTSVPGFVRRPASWWGLARAAALSPSRVQRWLSYSLSARAGAAR